MVPNLTPALFLFYYQYLASGWRRLVYLLCGSKGHG